MKHVRSILLLTSALVLAAACSGGSATTPRPTVAPLPSVVVPSLAVPSPAASSQPAGSGGLPSATDLCSLLTPIDWSTYQLTATQQPKVSSDEPGSAYCTWSDKSGAQGGLELDVFVSDTAADAEDTYKTVADELPGAQPVDLPGVDAALINPNVDGMYGAILVRNGRLTYTIALPASAGSQVQLESLAGLVLSRAQQYT